MDDLDKFPSQLAERFQVRLPDGMRDRLKAAAEANNRSMNAEIVARLANSLADDDDGGLPKVGFELFQPVAAAVAEQTVLRMMDVWLGGFDSVGAKDDPPVERLRKYLADMREQHYASLSSARDMANDKASVEKANRPRKGQKQPD